jgi:hypothetical protein
MVFHDLQSVGVIDTKNIPEPRFDILTVATLQSIDDTQEVVPWKSLLLPTKASFECLTVANYAELPRNSEITLPSHLLSKAHNCAWQTQLTPES